MSQVANISCKIVVKDIERTMLRVANVDYVLFIVFVAIISVVVISVAINAEKVIWNICWNAVICWKYYGKYSLYNLSGQAGQLPQFHLSEKSHPNPTETEFPLLKFT